MSEVNVERLAQYSLEDAEQLGKLMPFLSSSFSGEPIDTELLDAIISSAFHDQLVARQRGRIIGAATLSLVMGAAAGKKGYLEDFVVHPDTQGQGIGIGIWEEMISWCREQGVSTLNFTSAPSKEAAHRFYHANGAIERDTTVFRVDVH
ncbi:MAG: GNAT family N-acetyltransferase [Candidatus Saccharimonadales bacterium]